MTRGLLNLASTNKHFYSSFVRDRPIFDLPGTGHTNFTLQNALQTQADREADRQSLQSLRLYVRSAASVGQRGWRLTMHPKHGSWGWGVTQVGEDDNGGGEGNGEEDEQEEQEDEQEGHHAPQPWATGLDEQV